MVFDSFSVQILREGPEAIQVNFITESGSQCVHKEASAGSLDRNFVGQPVTRGNKNKSKTEENVQWHIVYSIEITAYSKQNAHLSINFSVINASSVYVLRKIYTFMFFLFII